MVNLEIWFIFTADPTFDFSLVSAALDILHTCSLPSINTSLILRGVSYPMNWRPFFTLLSLIFTRLDDNDNDLTSLILKAMHIRAYNEYMGGSECILYGVDMI